MPVAIEIAQSTEWMTQRAASQVLKRSPAAVMRLAVGGQIRVKNDPGRTPLYSRSDVERIASQQGQARPVGA